MNNDIMPLDVREAANKIGNDWIKGEEFEGEGLVLQVVKPLEKIRSQNPKYGAQETDFLVRNEILDVGETFRFTFLTTDGTERKIDTKSSPFFIGFKQCEELGVGDWVKITRIGKTTETRYEVVKVDASLTVNQPSVIDYPDAPQGEPPF